MENGWGFMKSECRKRSTFAKTESELFELLSDMWNNLPQSYFESLVKLMGTRASTVLDRKGNATKY